jgi:hypothetical protein
MRGIGQPRPGLRKSLRKSTAHHTGAQRLYSTVSKPAVNTDPAQHHLSSFASQFVGKRYQAYLRDGCKERPLKDELRAEMTGLIPGLSGMAFDGAWKATAVAKNWNWRTPDFGVNENPPKKPLQKTPPKNNRWPGFFGSFRVLSS